MDEAVQLAGADLARERLSSLFDRHEWFARTYALCPVSGTPLVINAAKGAVGAWLFLTKDDRGHARSLSSWYTLAFRPAFQGSPTLDEQTRLLRALSRQLRQHVASATLAPMREDDCAAMARVFSETGWFALPRQTDCNWTANVAGKSFAEYWAERPGQLRKTVKSKRKRAAMEVTIHDSFGDSAWADYESVYADSWKPEEGAAAFLQDMARVEGCAGTLRLGIGKIAGQAVAAQLWTCEGGVAIAHKVAHRESAREFSPGSLLSAAMFEQAIDVDRVDTFDFGTGNDAYKSIWMDRCAPLYTLDLYNKRSREGISAAARAIARKTLLSGRNRLSRLKER